MRSPHFNRCNRIPNSRLVSRRSWRIDQYRSSDCLLSDAYASVTCRRFSSLKASPNSRSNTRMSAGSSDTALPARRCGKPMTGAHCRHWLDPRQAQEQHLLLHQRVVAVARTEKGFLSEAEPRTGSGYGCEETGGNRSSWLCISSITPEPR
jgi:hypothetical protein